MVKVYAELEAGDIDYDDPVHAFLLGEVMIIGLSLPDVARRTNALVASGLPPEEWQEPIKELIASILNHARKSGIAITKSELPKAFSSSPFSPTERQ